MKLYSLSVTIAVQKIIELHCCILETVVHVVECWYNFHKQVLGQGEGNPKL